MTARQMGRQDMARAVRTSFRRVHGCQLVRDAFLFVTHDDCVGEGWVYFVDLIKWFSLGFG